MNEWTEQEEQEIIERAKTGDPEANYALSLWALRRGEEEPDEPRWNRLAAKCLVKAAQAGYGPAKEQMEALLHQEEQPAAPARQTAARRTAPPKAAEPEEEPAPEPQPAVRRTTARQTATARQAAPRRTAPQRPARRSRLPESDGFDADEDSWDEDEGDETDAPRRGFGLNFGRGRGGRSSERSGGGWTDDQWRKMEFICVFVCAALLVIIAVLIITGRSGGSSNSGSGGGSAIPPAGEVGSQDGAGTGATAGEYPDAATQAAIMAADLDIQPAPEDYVAEATTGTVSVSSEYLRLRKGPNTTYDPIAQMPNGTTVSVYAIKNDWDLILYQGDEGPIYGWCSSEYVILNAGGGTNPAADAAAAAAG